MSNYLHISVTFLDARFHGRGDGGEPEWPPSPLRLIQAMVAANADMLGTNGNLEQALTWLQSQPPPAIIAPHGVPSEPYSLSVPNNAMDIVGRAWSKENYFGGGDSNPAKHRTMKTVRSTRMTDGDTIHYLWKLSDTSSDTTTATRTLCKAVGRIVALGWGIDLIASQVSLITSQQFQHMTGERWSPSVATNMAALRVPIQGTLEALKSKHEAFLQRIGKEGFSPVEPLACFDIVGYRRPDDPITRPWALFELRNDDGSFSGIRNAR